MKKDEKKVMYDSDEAAKRVTGVSGWVDINGRFWGEEEHMARWVSCTHLICECGKEMVRGWTKCEKCRRKKSLAKFLALEQKEWDGVTPLCLSECDTYFFSEDDLYQYAEDVETTAETLNLIICEPVHLRQIDDDYWCDDLCEDGELPSEVEDALEVLNKVIREQKPEMWMPGKFRAIV